jgi:hypothetical protein
MTVYTVRFCDKEFVAHNLKDFARIAVFAKWYLRTQALSGKLHCSVQQAELSNISFFPTFNNEVEKPLATKNDIDRRPRMAVMRKAIRAFFYSNFA